GIPLAFESLPTARGLHWKDGFRGYLNTGERVAQVRLDATGAVRIRVDLDRRPAPPEALVLNAALPANLRVAGPAHRPHLLADIAPDQAGFSRSLSEIRQGIRRNADGMGIGRRPPHGERRPYEHLFDQLRDGPGSLDVVDRDPGWELGLRFRGGRVAVQVSPERNGLRLYRIVLKQAELSGVESGSEGLSVEGLSVNDLALRLNEDMRFVRLARIDAGVAVEARLSRALVDVERVVETASAIAVVSVEVGIPLRTLLQMEGVARCYADTFDLPHGETQQ
ncbi:MAG: hypothetical protein IH921_07865, partial [Gemmatimonadetes bacterium]|nr:hypothetical protein [Gemmatimonadota bacterium]